MYLTMFEQTPMSFTINILTWSLTVIVCFLFGIYIGRLKKMAPILKKYEKDNDDLRKKLANVENDLTKMEEEKKKNLIDLESELTAIRS